MGKRLCLCLLEPGVRRKHHTCETFCFFPPQSEYLKKTKQTKKKTLPFGSEGCKRFCIFEAEAELFSLPFCPPVPTAEKPNIQFLDLSVTGGWLNELIFDSEVIRGSVPWDFWACLLIKRTATKESLIGSVPSFFSLSSVDMMLELRKPFWNHKTTTWEWKVNK